MKVEIKPCPLCGREPSHIGCMSALTMGIECGKCGLFISRRFPNFVPKKCIRKTVKETMREVEKHVLLIAIKKWNRRVKT